MKCAIAGATGLVGKELLALLLSDAKVKSVLAVGRTKVNSKNAKLKNQVVSFDKLKSIPDIDAAFCCLGTTIAKAGSKDAFHKVDNEYILSFARACEGARVFAVVSALGANEDSRFFYNKVKGETENELRELEFPRLIILRPSLLLGEREERRPAEKIAQKAAALLSPFMIGPLAIIRAVSAKDVAKKMKDLAMEEFSAGVSVVENRHI